MEQAQPRPPSSGTLPRAQPGVPCLPRRDTLNRTAGSAPSAPRNASHREGSILTEQTGMPLQVRETPRTRVERSAERGENAPGREGRRKSREQVGVPQSMMGTSHSRCSSPQSWSPNSQGPEASSELPEHGKHLIGQ